MGAGLDSLSAVDLVQTLGQRLGTELEPTALFDYPTIGSLTKYLAAQEEPETPLVSESDDVVPVPLPAIEAGGKAVQECFVVATAMYLPTVERSFTNGDLQGLSHGRFETATLVPATRWNMDSIDTRRFSADARSRVRYGSFLQGDFSMFDNTMFRISPAEARPLEPQQRMLLEVGYEALHRQGQSRSTLADSDTGIFTGMMNMDAQHFMPSVPGPYDMTGITYSAAGARLSYVFAMRGPCMVFDTACSSSLIAMHAARRSMQHNECPLALTIGPNAILHPGAHVGPALTGMTSIRGRCHTFDARADGYLRGEGCGAVVLDSARRTGEDAYQVSCPGSSARHNGQSATFTALNGLSQQLLIKAALGDASTTVGNVMEAHGTGTGLGDPIEISSISAIVKKSGHKTCSVCAIKGNVGHTESTAGVANVIEVIGLLKLGEAALNVQLRTLNPQVRQVRAEVLHPSVDTNLLYRSKTQTGGASSFGWSGIIAHGVFQYEKRVEARSEARDFASASLYRNYSLLVRRERQLSTTRRIALVRHSRKQDISSQIPKLAAYYREPVLLGCPLQAAPSQSYVASVDPGTDDERNTAAPVGGCSKNLLDKATQETLHRRPDIASESQHTNVDSMLRFVVSPELQGPFGQNQLMEAVSRHPSNATFNSQDRNPPYEAKTQARRLLGESALSINIPGAMTADSSLQRIEPAKEKIGEIARSVSFQFQAGVSLLRGICLQLPISLHDKPKRRAAHQTPPLITTSANSAGDLQSPKAPSASLDAHKVV
jgi:3-oxoacyl-(acyl-carrier-protein) synthase